MRKPIFLKRMLVIAIAFFSLMSCKNDDDGGKSSRSINEFVYDGLDIYYLYKDDQPLFNQSFNSINQGSPEDFFELLTVAEDRFSFIFYDYEILEAFFEGTTYTDGMSYILYEDNGFYYAAVTKVAKGSNAESAGIKRGDLITKADGNNLDDTYSSRLSNNNNYTVERSAYNVTTESFEPIDTVNLTKEDFTEDPITVAKVIEEDGIKVGYLMYDGFIGASEIELNEVFATFQGIDELVLDLRYNGGGSVATAVALSSMITGQFTGEVFVKEQWNSEAQAYFESEFPDSLVSLFKDSFTVDGQQYTINSLELDKLYVISSKNATASASEMVINSLSPFIDVVHIGDSEGTVGKSQASTTLYDSENFNKEDLNPNHKYVMQPLIYRSVNNINGGVPNEGLTPNVIATENALDLGILGDPNEPLLRTALDQITGQNLAAKSLQKPFKAGKFIGTEKSALPTYQRMYININSLVN